MKLLDDESRYKILKLLEQDPGLSQRELAQALNISLGKANYCIKALIHEGWLKISNFASSKNKKLYCYLLTPAGLEEKTKVTLRFLKLKQKEYEKIKRELECLKIEASNIADKVHVNKPNNGV